MNNLDLFDLAPQPPSPPTGGGRWFTLPPHRPFLHDVAGALHAMLGDLGPEALSQAVVLTPTRRTARALAEAFVTVAKGRAVLLPQIRTLGDLDEGEAPFEPGDIAVDLPPAVTPQRRRFELAGIVTRNADILGRPVDALGALHLADALALFLDAVHIEEAKVDGLALTALAPPELAKHWEVSTKFLALALELWPLRLAELGLVDATQRRTQLIRTLARRWAQAPPEGVLVAAGAKGESSAEIDLLCAVARAPRGAVFLPGLDADLAPEAWAQIEESHPQFTLKTLLDRAGVSRAQVQPWIKEREADAVHGKNRLRVVNEALRPAASTDAWPQVIEALRPTGWKAGDPDPVADGLDGLTVLSAANDDDAAAQCALLLREALETPGRTAALVTPDPALARRVSARLARWGVLVDSSAGAPLDRQPAGSLMALMAALAADPADPGALLAVAKHPLVRLGRPSMELDLARRQLERYGPRGPRPRGWAELLQRLEADEPRKRKEQPQAKALGRALQAAVERALEPFAETGASAAPAAVRALAEALELACSDEKGAPGELWSGPGGEEAAKLTADLVEDAKGLPPVTPHAFADVMGALLRGVLVRPGAHAHPRLRILGLIEARLIRSDLVILAGLEEGSWPRPAATDPILSRAMRKALGLPSPERRIGVSAHDFAQAACGPEAVLIASYRRGGQPATRSRWLWRLEMLAKGADLKLPGRPSVAAWARALDAAPPEEDVPPSLKLAERPAPTPPVALRPRRLAATRVEEWIRDPYATYARYILDLKSLDRPDLPLEARARGTAVHNAFETFATAHPDLPWGEAAEFEGLLIDALRGAGLTEAGLARERPLARRLGVWAAELESQRRPSAKLVIEEKGEMTFAAPGGPFTLEAKADRLEVRPDRIDVIDFKSGGLSSKKEVKSGLAPQLTLTAAIAKAGGFPGVPALPPGELIYARVTGLRDPGALELRMEGEAEAGADAALEGLKRRVASFDHVATPYRAKAVAKFIREDGSGDYDHLERLWEWRVVGEGDDDGGDDS
ncbi:double-strand break repair protein AddB [soil metagenome]